MPEFDIDQALNEDPPAFVYLRGSVHGHMRDYDMLLVGDLEDGAGGAAAFLRVTHDGPQIQWVYRRNSSWHCFTSLADLRLLAGQAVRDDARSSCAYQRTDPALCCTLDDWWWENVENKI